MPNNHQPRFQTAKDGPANRSAAAMRPHRAGALARRANSVEQFAVVNAIDARYFLKAPPARIFVNVPA